MTRDYLDLAAFNISEVETHAMLDETPIGPFLELEGPARWIDRMAKRLGFTEKDYVTASYGALWAAHQNAAGMPLEDFIFPPRRKA